MDKIIEISNLKFAYEDKVILDNFNCEVFQGDFAALIGENGAGKSTLLKLLLGQLQADAGEIKLFGDDIRKNNHFDDIAYISQNAVDSYKHFPTTIAEVLKIHLRYLKKRVNIDDYLMQVGLYEQRNLRLSKLSGGQLQRVGLLLALIKDSKLIILDEPTSNIDSKFTHEFFRSLGDLARDGKTILMVSHHLDDIHDFVDYLLKLEKGRCERQSV